MTQRCAECHFFPYPIESPWDGPAGLEINPLDLDVGTVVTLEDGSWYFPHNIFLNKYDMKCTSDCAAEGRNYVNPFSYDVQDVIDWYSDVDGGNETYPFENRRNLGLIPHPNYWFPYSFENGPFECVCDEESGFVYDELADDGSCFNCGSIGWELMDNPLIGMCS
jgi:hypothetical protein